MYQEFKEGDRVHFHPYNSDKPKQRRITGISKDLIGGDVWYQLGSGCKTKGLCIVESDLYIPPKPALWDYNTYRINEYKCPFCTVRGELIYNDSLMLITCQNCGETIEQYED